MLESHLKTEITSAQPASLYDPITYTLEGRGKKLRPILLLLTAESLGGSITSALPAATALEIVHNFTLVHDDIMDNDATRRGRPTVHSRWDNNVALLAGDGLVALAYRTLLKLDSRHLVRICTIFTEGILELCEGQALDRDFETRQSIEMDEYLVMIQKKTGKLLSMCSQIGGIVADAPEHVVELLRIFGESLGMAFQIQDDLLDITADENILGKDFGSDIKQKKKTFLLVHALESATAGQKEKIVQILNMETIHLEQVYQLRSIFDETGTIAATQQAANNYITKAENCLLKINGKAQTNGLQELAQLILHRQA